MSDSQRYPHAPGTGDAGLIVGVTGHRDLRAEELPRLRLQVRDFFLALQQRYPGLPLSLLSPLAAGADQLVTTVAMELGLRVIAVLPVPVDMYREDFASEAARRSFD
ncbi:MAG: hypothetical protein KA187_06445, partial [Arenimonas sp.]|nr:hypothetical protein [Arenimonas sp.]